jgi:hypothetical protein
VSTTPTSLARARRDDTERRRQRVLDVLAAPAGADHEPSVAAVARAAHVHRTFIYRHPDLLAAVLAHIADPPTAANGAQVSRNSLLADLANIAERNARLTQQISQLEHALSQAMGQRVWKETGLGAPPDVEQLQQRILQLEQQLVDLRQILEERDDELSAARAANRELLAQANRSRPR